MTDTGSVVPASGRMPARVVLMRDGKAYVYERMADVDAQAWRMPHRLCGPMRDRVDVRMVFDDPMTVTPAEPKMGLEEFIRHMSTSMRHDMEPGVSDGLTRYTSGLTVSAAQVVDGPRFGAVPSAVIKGRLAYSMYMHMLDTLYDPGRERRAYMMGYTDGKHGKQPDPDNAVMP